MSLSLKPIARANNTGLNVTMALSATPMLTTVEAKALAKIDFSDHDTFVDALVTAATLWVQKKINRALINQTVIAEWDSVDEWVPLPYAPIVSITSIKTIDNEATETVLVANTGYFLRNNKIKVATHLGLRATYVAGYGAASTNVPGPIKEAIGRIVINLYDRRDDEMESIDKVAFNSMALLDPYINESI